MPGWSDPIGPDARSVRDRGQPPAAGWVDEILAPLGPAAFLAESWNQGMRHLPGRPGRFAGMLDWTGLSRLLEWTAMQPPRLRVVRGGVPVAEERYLRVHNQVPRIDGGRLALELDAGATLIVNFADELVPALAALADEIAEAFAVRVNANLYASWREENGLPLHWDTHGVLVLQLAGRKRWTVHAPTRELPLEGEPFKPPASGVAPLWDGVLEDGDVLYLPRGYPHLASAYDGPSLHLTLSLIESTGVGFLRWLVESLNEEVSLRAAVPRAEAGDTPAEDRWLADLREVMTMAVTPAALATFRAARLADKPARPRFALPDFSRTAPRDWTGATSFRLASERAVRLRYRDDGSVQLRAAGRDWPCPPPVATALATLSSTAAVPLARLEADLAHDDLGSLRRLLALLFAAGGLAAENPRAG